MKTFTKSSLIEALLNIRQMGWVPCSRPGNVGGVGNTLEDLLGIPENNLPIPNASEWELKCQRLNSSALLTLFHMEPSPRGLKLVSNVLLPKYGWAHQQAGKAYPIGEKSFRQTINGKSRSDRGFMVLIDRKERKVVISFDPSAVSSIHEDWLHSVEQRIGLEELEPQPYWGFDDLFHKAGTKLLNAFYVGARSKIDDGKTFFWYDEITILSGFRLENFIDAIESGFVFVDFDSRTGHNHGTKFRIAKNQLPQLYSSVERII